MNGPIDLTYGMENTKWKQCAADSDLKTAPTGHRAKCALGYFDGKKFPKNTTPCFFSIDDPDWACRRSVGFRQDSKMSLSKPSQVTYGMKEMINKDRKCGGLKRRAVCEMGYSNGVKLPDFSTRCRKRLDNFGDACKEAYGQEYFPIPVEDDKKLGCKLPLTAARAVCRKDTDIKLNTEFTNAAYEIAGQQCTWPFLANTDMTCSHYYGPNYQHVGWSKDVKLIDGKKGKNGCHTTFRKGRCKKVKELKDMKNQVCLWTNRSCGGKKCKDRCPAGWTALNPEKKCGYSGWLGTPNKANGESQSCLCCKDKKDDDDTNLYFNAIDDTTGQVKGQKTGDWDAASAMRVGSESLYLCKHSAFWDDRRSDAKCSNNVTTNLKDAHKNHKAVYVPMGSDTSYMSKKVREYKNYKEGFDNYESFTRPKYFKNTGKNKWVNLDRYSHNLCSDLKNTSKIQSCITPQGQSCKGVGTPGSKKQFWLSNRGWRNYQTCSK